MELLDYPSNVAEQFVERCNDWIARQRPVSWEDYVDGKAELTWMLKFTAFGRWHKAWFKAQVVDRGLDANWSPWSAWHESDLEIREGCCDDDRLVFVSYVGSVETPQGFVSTRIGLGLSADLLRLITGLFGPTLNHKFDVATAMLGEREVAILDIPAANFDNRCDADVQGGSEIVDCIPKDGADFDWWHFVEGDLKAKLPVLKVRYLSNAVIVSAEEVVGEKVHLSNVRFRSIKLQKRC